MPGYLAVTADAVPTDIAQGAKGKSELEKLARAEQLSMEIVQLGRMICSIGMLVSSDGEGRSGPRAGSFQSADDVTELLFCLGELVEAKGELVSIANNAQWKLGEQAILKR